MQCHWGVVIFVEIFSRKAVLWFKGRHKILSVLLAFTVQFGVRDLHTKLLSIFQFLESRHGKGCALLVHVSKSKLRVYRKSLWIFESKERLGVVRVQRRAVHHLLSRYVVVRCMDMAWNVEGSTGKSLYHLVTRNCCSILNHRLKKIKQRTSERTLLWRFRGFARLNLEMKMSMEKEKPCPIPICPLVTGASSTLYGRQLTACHRTDHQDWHSLWTTYAVSKSSPNLTANTARLHYEPFG